MKISQFTSFIKENSIKNEEPKVSRAIGRKNQSLQGRTKTQKAGRTHRVVAVAVAVVEGTRAGGHRTKAKELAPAGGRQKV